MAAGWLAAAAAAAFSLLFFSQIKDTARIILGVEAGSSAPTAEARRSRVDTPEMHAAGRGHSVEIRAGAHGHH